MCMYVCLYPPLRSQTAASVANNCSEGVRGGSGPSGGRGDASKRQIKEDKKAREPPGPRVSTAKARAAPGPQPGPGQLESASGRRAGRYVAWDPAGYCPGGSLWPTNASRIPVTTPSNSQRIAQGGVWAGSPRAQEGGLSAPGLRLPPSSQCVAGASPRRLAAAAACVRSCRCRRHRRRHCVPWLPPSRGRPVRRKLGARVHTRASRMRQASGNPRPLVQGPADPGLQVRSPGTQDVRVREVSRGVPSWGQGPRGGAR